MSKKTKRLLAVIVVLLLLPVFWLIAERARGEWQFAAWTKAMRARGEKLTLDELVAGRKTPPQATLLTPADVELLLAGLSSARETAPPLGRITGPGRAIAFSQRTGWRGGDDKDRGWTDFERATDGDRARLPGIRARLTNETIRVRLDFGQGFDLMLPHLARFKGAAQAFAYEAMYDLHQGDRAGALANLRGATALVDLLEGEDLLISQLVRIAVAGIAPSAVWEALQDDGWSDAQLAGLQADWARLRFLAATGEALRMERAVAGTYFPGGRHSSRAQMRQLVAFGGAGGAWSSGWNSGRFAWLAAFGDVIDPVTTFFRAELWRYVWAKQDQLVHHRTIQANIDWTRDHAERRDCRGMEALSAAEATALNHAPDRFLVSRSGLAAYSKMIEKAALTEAWREIIVTAIALKRFHLRHAEWPASLDELVPGLLPETPVDWMDGRPLRYRREPEGGFLLYSVGSDGRDDGGDPRTEDGRATVVWQSGRDLVWPRAATTEEIAAYEAELIGNRTGPGRARWRPGRGRP
ncbi:MAG: hypothetical protein H7A45_18170 [Verrucomicrobiales bacterium]|nr:hypothetical protein [Verrucomicrobiales bacterium]MCP5525489.1 hypothetical protein [Verrucomicrobiales bacterium]